MMKRFLLSVVAATIASSVWATETKSLPSLTDISLLNEVKRAEARGLEFLMSKQMENGSWNMHPAVTGLAITALLRHGGELSKEQQAVVDKGVKFILSNVKDNGAIYGGGETDKFPNYSTAICTMALLATGKEELVPIIKKARQFLLQSQFDQDEETGPGDASFGGIGYGKRQRPDLSNTMWALEALRLTEHLQTKADDSPHTDSQLHWKKAAAFLSRCQNLPDTNDQPWAKEVKAEDKGGFIYMPGDPKKGIPPLSFADDEVPTEGKTPLRSYGSMTYAGLKSMLYAELKKDDPRVKAAVDWLSRNYTLEENPGLGQQGLYYYYHTVTKALTAYGEDTFKDSQEKVRDWRYEMMKKFVNLQKADGFWQNENNRWWENDPVLCTAYSLISLEILQKRQYP